MGAVRVRALEQRVQSTLCFGEGALHRYAQRFEARGADRDEQRGLGLNPARQVPQPGRDEIGPGQVGAEGGHGRNVPALAGPWQAALLRAGRAAQRLLSHARSEIERTGRTRLEATSRWQQPGVTANGVGAGVSGAIGHARGRRPLAVLGAFGSVLVLLAAGSFAGLRLNLTGSLPVGLYRAAPGPVVRGVRVLVCLPPRVAAFARARGYVPRGGVCPGGILPVGKPVLALPGDTVTVTAGGLRVNGVALPNSLALATDQRGRPLPRLAPGSQVVRPGTLWVLSAYSPRSFDSRYFGPVALGAVRSSLQPVWTAGCDPCPLR